MGHAIQIGLLTILAITLTPFPARAEMATATQPATTYVAPIDLQELNQKLRSLPAERRKLVASYADAARRTVLDITDGCYPDTSFREHYRNLAERAKGAAILSTFEDLWPEEFRRHCRAEVIGHVREVADEFRKHPIFQYEWQAAFWAAEAAIAGWFLWDELDRDLQKTIAEMVIFQADRFINVKPVTCYRGNTEAESIAWNSTICTLAVNMMPGHPHNSAWDRAAKVYLYNTFSVSQDMKDDTVGDNGRPVKDWVVGPNLYDDFGLENHKMFHIDYVFACYRFHIQGAVMYWLTGHELPMAFRHHIQDVYEKLMLPCMNHEGFFVYVSDNDWKRYHNWTESCALHAYMAFLVHHPLAGALEQRAAANAVRYWGAFPSNFGYDNPYVCGKPWTSRIADIVLMHILCPHRRLDDVSVASPDPVPQGTYELKSAGLLTHHSSQGSFRSVCKGKANAWVRFVAPSAESWIMLPLTANYRGQIDGQPILSADDIRSERGDDWFWMMQQDSSSGVSEIFVSLPDEIALFIEYAPAGVFSAGTIVENTVAIEKPHRKLTIRYEGGRADVEHGKSGWQRSDGSEDLVVPGDWLNVDDRMGLRFVVPHESTRPELMLPRPGRRDAIRARMTIRGDEAHSLCIAICPNQDAEHTATLDATLEVNDSDQSITCVIEPYVLIWNFGSEPLHVPSRGSDSGDTVIRPAKPAAWLSSGKRVF